MCVHSRIQSQKGCSSTQRRRILLCERGRAELEETSPQACPLQALSSSAVCLRLSPLALSETVPSVCSSSLGPPLSHFHFLKEDKPLIRGKSYDGSLPGAEKMHRETEKVHLIEIIVSEGQPLKGRQRELQVESTKMEVVYFM